MPRKTEKRSVSRRNNGRSGRSGTVRRSNSRTLSRKKRTYSNISNRVSQTRKTVGSYKAMINKKVYGDCKTKMISSSVGIFIASVVVVCLLLSN